MKFDGSTADQSHGAIGILANFFLQTIGRVFFPEQSVFEHKGGHADTVEEKGGIPSFSIINEETVATSRTDEHSGACCFIFRRKIYGYGRVMDIFNPIILCLLRDIAPVFKAGRSIGP